MSRLITITGGVIVALLCYGVLDRLLASTAVLAGSPSALRPVHMVEANIAAVVAAAIVVFWPWARGARAFDALVTWAVSTLVLMIVLAPGPASMTVAGAG